MRHAKPVIQVSEQELHPESTYQGVNTSMVRTLWTRYYPAKEFNQWFNEQQKKAFNEGIIYARRHQL